MITHVLRIIIFSSFNLIKQHLKPQAQPSISNFAMAHGTDGKKVMCFCVPLKDFSHTL